MANEEKKMGRPRLGAAKRAPHWHLRLDPETEEALALASELLPGGNVSEWVRGLIVKESRKLKRKE